MTERITPQALENLSYAHRMRCRTQPITILHIIAAFMVQLCASPTHLLSNVNE